MEHIQMVDPDSVASTRMGAAERVRRIRARLPGQVLRERLDNAAASYGPLYSLAELQRRVGETLPSQLGHRRTSVLEPIESYRGRIPDDALLRYDDALASGLFAGFWVATPAYMEERQADPWIVGEVADANAYAVIARWD
jgi:hypothetical protein